MGACTGVGFSMLGLMVAIALVLVVVAADDFDDSEDVALDPSVPSSPPVLPLLLPATSAATEVTVHVAERFLPFASRTTVGPYARASQGTGEEEQDADGLAFRVMFSFAAYPLSASNAATMDCFAIYDNGRAWEKATPDPPRDRQAFCARRDVADDSSSYGVAVFCKRGGGSCLVHASRDPTATVIAQATVRGWTEPPMAVFRAQRLEQWQVAPSLTLVANVTAISVGADAVGEIASHCPLDTNGRVIRRIEGGNYYQNASESKITVLCVSYVQRSLHDLNGVDTFFANVRPVELSNWRFNVCPWGSNEIMDAATHINILLNNAGQEPLLICYTDETLANEDDEDDVSDLTDTDELLKRIWINETEPLGIKRLVIERHDADAWTFAPHDDDLAAINSF